MDAGLGPGFLRQQLKATATQNPTALAAGRGGGWLFLVGVIEEGGCGLCGVLGWCYGVCSKCWGEWRGKRLGTNTSLRYAIFKPGRLGSSR